MLLWSWVWISIEQGWLQMICLCPKRMEKYGTDFRSHGKQLGKEKIGKYKETSKLSESWFMGQLKRSVEEEIRWWRVWNMAANKFCGHTEVQWTWWDGSMSSEGSWLLILWGHSHLPLKGLGGRGRLLRNLRKQIWSFSSRQRRSNIQGTTKLAVSLWSLGRR